MNQSRAIEAVMGRGYDRPGFPSLFANANAAQAIYDADFVLPSSPAMGGASAAGAPGG